MAKMSLIKKYISMKFQRTLEYKSNFLFMSITFLLFGFMGPLLLIFAYNSGGNIQDWSIQEILFLSGFFMLSESIFRTFLWGINQIRVLVRKGEMEKFLIKPVNALLHVSISNINFEGLPSIFAGIILISFSKVPLSLNFFLLFSVYLSLSVMTIFAFHTIINSLAFWFTEVSSLFWSVRRLIHYGKYPLSIYNLFMVVLFTTVIPLGIMSYYPSVLILGKSFSLSGLISATIFGIVFFFFSIFLFNKGIENYTSAGG